MKKGTWKYVAVGAVISAVAVIGVGALFGRDSDEEKKETLNAFDYGIFRLDDTTGKKDEDDKSGISTKDYYKLDELQSIEIGENEVTYYVNVYDKDKTFIKVDEYKADMTDIDFTAYERIGAVYFKVEIVDPEDEEINFFEQCELAKLVTVTLGEAESAGTTETE